MSHSLAKLSRVSVGEDLFLSSHSQLRELSRRNVEAMAIWAGRFSSDSSFDVLAVHFPYQHALRGPSGLAVIVDSDALHRLNVWLYKNELTAVAQIHTHPGEAFHSSTDDEIPVIASLGGLSLVVPNFARGPASIHTYAVFRLNSGREWVPIMGRDREIVRIVASGDNQDGAR